MSEKKDKFIVDLKTWRTWDEPANKKDMRPVSIEGTDAPTIAEVQNFTASIFELPMVKDAIARIPGLSVDVNKSQPLEESHKLFIHFAMALEAVNSFQFPEEELAIDQKSGLHSALRELMKKGELPDNLIIATTQFEEGNLLNAMTVALYHHIQYRQTLLGKEDSEGLYKIILAASVLKKMLDYKLRLNKGDS